MPDLVSSLRGMSWETGNAEDSGPRNQCSQYIRLPVPAGRQHPVVVHCGMAAGTLRALPPS